MKLQIDTQNKTITIVEDVKLQELNEFIRLAIPESELSNWKITTSKEVIQTPPIVIEKWKERPWNEYYPWWENPWHDGTGTYKPRIWYNTNITLTGTSQIVADDYISIPKTFTVELR